MEDDDDFSEEDSDEDTPTEKEELLRRIKILKKVFTMHALLHMHIMFMHSPA